MMKIGKKAPQIYQYPINLDGKEGDHKAAGDYIYSVLDVGKVVDRNTAKLELLIGKFIYSGYNIWTTQRLEETIMIDAKLMGKPV